MKIAIDIRSTLKKRTGIGNYTFGLVNALGRIDRENKYFLYSYIRPFDIKRRLWPLPGPNFKHRVDRMSFNPRVAMSDVDVLHTSSYDMPSGVSYGLFTTVHDLVPLIFPQGYSDDYLKEYEGDLKRVFRESRVIIADSFNTKKDIETMFPGDSPRIEVVYPGKDESFKVLDRQTALNSLKDRYGISDRFLLYSGGMDPRKNIMRLVEAFNTLKHLRKVPHKLVLIGALGKWAGDVAKKVAELGLEKETIFTGYVPGYELNNFYSAADCFIYPSLYEGFGFPILEAFTAGTPVVTSSTSSCQEIAKDAALTVDPLNTEELSEAIYRVITDKELEAKLISLGTERARDFSWENSARRILELFRER